MYYFIPNGKTISRKLFAEHGLDELIDRSPQARETSRGPSGESGLMVCSSTDDTAGLTYDPATQVWQKRFGSTCYVGMLKDKPPTPASLARSEMLNGAQIKLLDGNFYRIPRLRSFHDTAEGPLVFSCNLDQVLEQDPETGRMVPGDVTPQYRQVWDTATKIGNVILEQITSSGLTSATLDDGILDDFVALVLRLNYRLDKPEISMLRLLTSGLSSQVLSLALDLDTMRALLKNRQRRSA